MRAKKIIPAIPVAVPADDYRRSVSPLRYMVTGDVSAGNRIHRFDFCVVRGSSKTPLNVKLRQITVSFGIPRMTATIMGEALIRIGERLKRLDRTGR